jgi:alpha-glucosidase
VLSNHDQPRHASRLATSVDGQALDQDAVARAAALILLSQRGTPFLYYGEELGMGDVAVPPDESIDAPAARVAPDFPWWDRSQARTPMPWTGEPTVGFTSAERPWLRVGPDVATRNVAAQAADPGSVLGTYRRLIAARRATRALQDGGLRLLRSVPEDVLGYRRASPLDPRDEVLVLVAFGPGSVDVRLPRPRGDRPWRPLVGTARVPASPWPQGRGIRLRPLEGVILTTDR